MGLVQNMKLFKQIVVIFYKKGLTESDFLLYLMVFIPEGTRRKVLKDESQAVIKVNKLSEIFVTNPEVSLLPLHHTKAD